MTAAAGLMMLLGVINLVSTVLALTVMDTAKQRFRDAAAAASTTDTTIDQTLTFITVIIVVGIIYNIIVVAALSVLALFNLRGNNATRITTWVVCGLFLVCGLCGIAGQGFNSVVTGDDASQALNQAAANMYPGWFNTVTIVTMVIQVLCYIGVIILLALPQSNAFFRNEPAPFQPPVSHPGV